MATRAQIIAFRLQAKDPAGILNIIDIADSLSLPVIPAQQTAYYLEDVGHYMITDIETGATPADYEQAKLYISDEFIGIVITKYGFDKAVCYAYGEISKCLGAETPLEENQTGTERTRYTSLINKYNYYKKLHDDCMKQYQQDNNNSTGQFLRTHTPTIAGGQV